MKQRLNLLSECEALQLNSAVIWSVVMFRRNILRNRHSTEAAIRCVENKFLFLRLNTTFLRVNILSWVSTVLAILEEQPSCK
jgi:hypothetical protein